MIWIKDVCEMYVKKKRSFNKLLREKFCVYSNKYFETTK